MPKIFAFIDVYNLCSSATEFGKNIDYSKLYSWLTVRAKCDKVFFYAGLEPGDIDTDNLYQQISSLGFQMRIKRMTIFKNRPKKTEVACPECKHRWIEKIDMGYRRKANCDVELTFDAMRMAHEYNEAIFITGDGDFFELLDWLAIQKKKISVVSRSYKNSRRMSIKFKELFGKQKANFIDLDSLKVFQQKEDSLVESS